MCKYLGKQALWLRKNSWKLVKVLPCFGKKGQEAEVELGLLCSLLCPLR